MLGGLDDVIDEDTSGAFSDVHPATLAVHAHPSRLLQAVLGIQKVAHVPEVGVKELDAAVQSVEHVDEAVLVHGDVDWTLDLTAVCGPAGVRVRHHDETRVGVDHL